MDFKKILFKSLDFIIKYDLIILETVFNCTLTKKARKITALQYNTKTDTHNDTSAKSQSGRMPGR